jgi:hypothetical protein
MAGTGPAMTRMGRLGWTLDALCRKRHSPRRADRAHKRIEAARNRCCASQPKRAAPSYRLNCQKTVPRPRAAARHLGVHDNRGAIRTQQEHELERRDWMSRHCARHSNAVRRFPCRARRLHGHRALGQSRAPDAQAQAARRKAEASHPPAKAFRRAFSVRIFGPRSSAHDCQ